MMRSLRGFCAVVLSGVAFAAPAAAQNEQFIPVLTYRTGAYAVNGVPYANGEVDYYNLVNARDGGIDGIRIVFEECETGYATDRGVECYERLKRKGPTGAAYVIPRSTGVEEALSERAATDRIPIVTPGHGRAVTKDGALFMWNFPLLGTYWSAADIIVQHIAQEIGGADKLAGKKIALLFHDSPYGREPIAALQVLAQKRGFEFTRLPVAHPGLEQKSQWRSIRQNTPDYVLVWGWGAVTPVALKEAASVGYPREKMIGVWWSAEPDVTSAGAASTGYKALMLQHGSGKFRVHAEIEKHVYARGKGAGNPQEIGQVLYNRGLVGAMIGVEAIRKAHGKFGRKPLTGEQVRWGLEHLEIGEARLRELGFEDMMKSIRVSCADHEGARTARVQQWDGLGWKVISDWYTADEAIIEPIVTAAAAKHAAERNIAPRDCSKEG